MMVKDVALTYKTLPQWEEYQKGLEALAASLESSNIQHGQPNKSLTVGDLLVKVRNWRIENYQLDILTNIVLAYPTCLPISTPFRRAASADSCVRLPRVTYGN